MKRITSIILTSNSAGALDLKVETTDNKPADLMEMKMWLESAIMACVHTMNNASRIVHPASGSPTNIFRNNKGN
jgi:hypothetical protein